MHIDVHIHAKDDLRRLVAADRKAVAAVLVLLEQLDADSRAIDKLTTHGDNYVGATRLSVKRWESVRGISNLWRFRMLDTPATSYRVIYGYHWQSRQLCVLAVVHKDEFDYDDHTSKISQRILADWKSL